MERAFNESFATGLGKLCCRRLPMGDKSFMDGPFKHTMDILESRPLEECSLIEGNISRPTSSPHGIYLLEILAPWNISP